MYPAYREGCVIRYSEDIYNVIVINSLEEFDCFAHQWDEALSQYKYHSIHLSSTYIKAILQSGDNTLSPYIIMITKADDIVAFTALNKAKYHYKGFTLNAALSLDYERYSRSDVVILEDAAIPKLYHAVQKIGVDIWHLDRFHSQSKFLRYCEQNLGDEYYSYEICELANLDTRQTWDEYLAKKSKNFRRSYKRITEASVSLRSEMLVDYDINCDKILKQMSSINQKSWKNIAGSDFSQDKIKINILKHLMESAAQKQNLVVCFLYDEDKAVAFTCGIIFQNILYAIETGYVEEYADRSAGIMSYAALMKYAFDHSDIISCDMDTIRENGAYKKRWATDIDSQTNVMILFGGFGSLLIRFGRLFSRMKKMILS